jgi:hypothetical protein
VSQVTQLVKFHWMLPIDKQRHFFAQHRYRREQHALLPLRAVVGQHHIDPAFGGVEQATFPVAQHDDLDLVTHAAEQVLHHARRQAAHLLAVTPGDRRVHRVIAIAHCLRGSNLPGCTDRQKTKPAPHEVQAATPAVNRYPAP